MYMHSEVVGVYKSTMMPSISILWPQRSIFTLTLLLLYPTIASYFQICLSTFRL